jgi:peptidoglycan/LPS O-acetylase OafA/YrhL
MLTLLQAARFFAAFLVLCYHTELLFGFPKYYGYHAFAGLFTGGKFGVDFFFVLSGFIIFHAHCNDIGNPSRLRDYIARRARRIFPAYWIVALIVLMSLYVVPSHFSDLIKQPSYVIRSILLLPCDNPLVTVSWSLQHEMMFYAMFAILIWHRAAGMLMLGLWFILSATIKGAELPSTDVIADPRHLHFLLGMAAAFITRHHRIPAPRGLLLLGLSGVAACVYVGGIGYGDLSVPGAPNLTLTVGIASAITLCALVELERGQGWRAPAFLRYLGDASYAIFLVHLPVLGVYVQIAHARHLEAVVPTPVLYALAILLSLAASVMFYYFVEQPLLSLLRRRGSDRPRMTAPRAESLLSYGATPVAER